MKQFINPLIKRLLFKLGYEIMPTWYRVADVPPEHKQIMQAVNGYTMLTIEAKISLVNTIDYIVDNRVPGAIVECGVWRGGSVMMMALALLAKGDTSRDIWVFDTFEGMSDPSEHDVSFDGVTAQTQLAQEARQGRTVWANAGGVDAVRANILSTGYPADKLHFVKGKVEDTIPGAVPGHIALLRLDTDFYESTKHELVHLYPLLDERGVLIIDDYGHWRGSRRAVDEYFRERELSVYLHRIDYAGRVVVRSGPTPMPRA